MITRVNAMIALVALAVLPIVMEYAFAEETVGCPHTVGKGKFKIRSKVGYIQAQKCYSDEVWKALHGDSPYSIDYDGMVDLPDGWRQRKFETAIGLEYGITDRLSAGAFIPFMMKDVKRQVWSNTANKTVWKEIEDNGLEDLWLSIKFLIFTKPPIWEDGLFLAIGYKPSLSSDEKIKNGIGSGTTDLKFVILSHPHLTESFFLCSDVWFQYCGKVKKIEDFSKSEWDLGNKVGYRAFFGYEFPNHRFVMMGGPQGWIAGSDKDKEDNEIEDSHTYSHGIVIKFRWMPFGEEDAGSIDLGVRIPYSTKTTFAPTFVPTVSGRIKF